MFRKRGNVFVLINSMALEGDGCNMCREAEEQLEVISHRLRCSQVGGDLMGAARKDLSQTQMFTDRWGIDGDS